MNSLKSFITRLLLAIAFTALVYTLAAATEPPAPRTELPSWITDPSMYNYMCYYPCYRGA